MQPDTTENTAGPTNRQSRKSNSLWGLLIAVVAGGVIAFGIVQLVPDDWRIQIDGDSKPAPRRRADTNRPGPRIQTGKTAGMPPETTGTPVVEIPYKPSPPKTPEDREAVALLNEAKGLIAKGKRPDAESLLERILNQYPGSTSEREARQLLNGC